MVTRLSDSGSKNNPGVRRAARFIPLSFRRMERHSAQSVAAIAMPRIRRMVISTQDEVLALWPCKINLSHASPADGVLMSDSTFSAPDTHGNRAWNTSKPLSAN